MSGDLPLRPALKPLSLLYSLLVRGRLWCYQTGLLRGRRLPGKVISVGNLTVGGTGKTPMVLWLAERLAAEGKRAGILTRGYRGSPGNNGRAQGEPQSDEVALLRARLKGKAQLGVGPDRYRNGMALARHGTDVFVLDDGLQHLQLLRDVEIVILDATDPFGGGMLLPAGRLREPPSALRRADVVVVTRSDSVPALALEGVIRRYSACPIFYATTRLDQVLRLPQLAVELPERDWRAGHFFAFCGIGNPAAFFDDLRRWGMQVAGQRSFADHHAYTAAEASELERAARECGAEALVCTEKDVWNLRNAGLSGMPAFCCRISLELPGDAVWTLIEEAIAGRSKVSQ